MPELPEVETVVRTLEQRIDHRTIKSVKVMWPKLIANMTAEQFSEKLQGQQFLSFDRRGKFLIFHLTDKILVAHLRMEGKFYVYPEKHEPVKFTHIIFELDAGELHYNDMRKFGRMYVYEKGEELTALQDLGYEPFDERLNSEYLKEYCRKSHHPIKTQLLDQGMIAGIGNIYANEICYEVKLNPRHPACFISRQKWDEIIAATKKILGEAIKAGGTTIRSYTSSLGVTGLFQQQLNVHSREKEECYGCGTVIVKEAVNGRGTYYCPSCQKEKPLLAAVTGNIGSGKSTAVQKIKEMGYPVISCDEINSQLLDQRETKEKLAEIFGCFWKDVDRDYIRSRIFSDPELKRQVESCLHAMIWQRIVEFYQSQSSKAVFVEVPLLFETDWYRRFDCNILVRSDRKALYERLARDRGMSEDAISSVLDSQMDDSRKVALADVVIVNNESLDKLYRQIEKTIGNIVKLLPGDE